MSDSKPSGTKRQVFARSLRDQKGQILGMMSVAYVWVAIAFVCWVMNSGMALCYKEKMINTDVQLAATGAIFEYYSTNTPVMGWTFGQIQPYIQAASTGNPGFAYSTFTNNYPTFVSSSIGQNMVSAETYSNYSMFGGTLTFPGYPWPSPGYLYDTKYFTIPANGTLPQ
jgi:hypothetical protein